MLREGGSKEQVRTVAGFVVPSPCSVPVKASYPMGQIVLRPSGLNPSFCSDPIGTERSESSPRVREKDEMRGSCTSPVQQLRGPPASRDSEISESDSSAPSSGHRKATVPHTSGRLSVRVNSQSSEQKNPQRAVEREGVLRVSRCRQKKVRTRGKAKCKYA